MLDLKRLHERLETLQSDLSQKTVYISDFMTQYASIIISTSAQVLRDMNNFMTDTQVMTQARLATMNDNDFGDSYIARLFKSRRVPHAVYCITVRRYRRWTSNRLT